MSTRSLRVVATILAIIKIILAVFMMVAGIATMLMPIEPYGGALGFLYSSRIAMVLFGTVFFSSGLTLFIGKVFRKERWTAVGLMAIYLCFMFAAILNGSALGWSPENWSPNAVAALVTGGLYMWHKYKMKKLEYEKLHAKAQRLGIR